MPFKGTTYFEYSKMEKRYWTSKYLLDQIQNKALSIKKVLSPNYKLLFIFDNTISHAIYAKDTLQVENINKGSDGQQPFLCLGWYIGANGEIII